MQEICHVLLMLDSLPNRQVTIHTLRRTRTISTSLAEQRARVGLGCVRGVGRIAEKSVSSAKVRE